MSQDRICTHCLGLRKVIRCGKELPCVWCCAGGTEWEGSFDDEMALAHLLLDEVLFCNCRYYSAKPDDKSRGKTVVLFVICNDIFAWGCADAEDLSSADIKPLYEAWFNDPKWGVIKWCCRKRGSQPQWPVASDMIRDGAWDKEMATLRPNLDRQLYTNVDWRRLDEPK